MGLFTITKVINPVTVMLKLPPLLRQIHPVFHSSLLKAIGQVASTSPPGSVNGNEYKIEEILDSKVTRGQLKYLIKWKGYPYEEASWVNKDNVQAPRLI